MVKRMEFAAETPTEIFNRQYDSLESFFNIKLPGDTPGDRAAALNNYSHTHLNEENRFIAYGRAIQQIAYQTASEEDIAPHNMHNLVVSFLAALSITGNAYTYRNPKTRTFIPRRQHWLPVAYLNQFATQEKSKKRRLVLPTLNYVNGEFVEKDVSDIDFIETHDQTFPQKVAYDPSVERFYGFVESYYALSRVKPTPRHLTLPAFFVTQASRNPHPSTAKIPINTTVKEATNTIIALLDKFNGTITSKVVNLNEWDPALAIAPWSPSRIRVQADGSTVYCFPTSRDQAVLISDSPDPIKHAGDKVLQMRETLIKQAVHSGRPILGIKAHEI